MIELKIYTSQGLLKQFELVAQCQFGDDGDERVPLEIKGSHYEKFARHTAELFGKQPALVYSDFNNRGETVRIYPRKALRNKK